MNRLFLLFIIGFICSCQHKKRHYNCDSIKPGGSFFTFSKPENNQYMIRRTGDIQTEYDFSTDSSTKCSVKWVSECEYELNGKSLMDNHFIEQIQSNHFLEDSIKKSLKVRITSVSKNYYTFELRKDGIDFVYKDTMWIEKLIGGFKSMSKVFK